MKRILLILLIAISFSAVDAQKYFSRTGEISFYSHTPIEDIEAESKSASTVYDAETGKIQWAVLIKSFEFEKALMQEHFNENYMESTKFPKASFKGGVEDYESVDLSKDGTYPIKVVGDLTIHGVKKPIEAVAEFRVKNGAIESSSSFEVAVADYGIEIPSVVKENIAKKIEITIKANYELLDKS